MMITMTMMIMMIIKNINNRFFLNTVKVVGVNGKCRRERKVVTAIEIIILYAFKVINYYPSIITHQKMHQIYFLFKICFNNILVF
jgi:hypothetical protein